MATVHSVAMAEPTGPVVLAIDGNSLVHRAFHSQARTGLRSATGEPMWAVRGLLSQLVAAIERIGPSHVVVGFDDPEHSVRRNTWPQYKAGRVDKPETLTSQLLLSAQILTELGIHVVLPAGWEADDVVASVAHQTAARGGRTIIVTSDRDSFALIDDSCSVLRILDGGVEASPLLSPERLELLLGIAPHQYRDYAALRGDASDNLIGVRGIGPKTAARLLTEFGSAAAMFERAAADGDALKAQVGAALSGKLCHPDARCAWELNCLIMTQRVDLATGLDDAGAGRLPLDSDTVTRVFRTLQLPWTTSAALRVLCGADVDVVPQYASSAWPPSNRSRPKELVSDQTDRADRAASNWSKRPGRLVTSAKPAKVEAQLSLFE